MFTGIIEATARITRREEVKDGASFVLEAHEVAPALSPGDSVSINGACHTVETSTEREFTVTSVGITLARTTMGAAAEGDVVNLECAATPQTALGGHLVQGHVDGMGRVHSFAPAKDSQDRLLRIQLPPEVAGMVVPKGSIAVDGISLTVADIDADGLVTITIIPYTFEKTAVPNYAPGSQVNIEVDIIGKYVMEYLNRARDGIGALFPGSQEKNE